MIRIVANRWMIACLSLAVAGFAVGQNYPARPIRLVVPFPTGGVADLFGRLVGAKLAERLGQQVVIDNRGGASGLMGHDIVAKARPDGYTLLLASSPLAKNAMLYRKVPHDAVRDFSPIAPLATTPLIFVIHPSLPASSVAELVTYAKANPGKLSFGASAPATAQHLAGEQFKRVAGIDLTYVPYKGSGSLLPDLIAGRLQLAFENVLTMAPLMKTGALRGIASTGAKRSVAVPQLPTMIESGVNFTAMGWYVIMGPATLPGPIVERLSKELSEIMSEPEMNARLRAQGVEVLIGGPPMVARILQDEIDRSGKLIRELGLRLD